MQREYLPSHRWMVHRERLTALLERAAEYPLVTVVAGPGYGKTLAVADFCRGAQRRVIWLRLLKLDNDPHRFWRSFLEATGREMPQLAETLSQQEFPACAGEYDGFLRAFAEGLYAAKGALLVLDGAECIENTLVHSFVDALVEAELEGLCTFLLCNRRLPSMAVLGEGRHYPLPEGELAFTLEEAQHLCELCGGGWPRGAVCAAWEQTGGWPMALQLLFIRPGPSAFAGAPHRHSVAELFERNHFSNYDADTRRLLVKLSFFQSIPLGLLPAIGVADVEKAAGILAQDIFVGYDYDAGVFSFQLMYRDFLAKKRDMLDPEETAFLLTGAGEWYRQNGHMNEAMECFWAVKNYARFLSAVLDMPRRRGSAEATNRVLERLDHFPPELQTEEWSFCRAFMLLNNGQVRQAKALLGGLYAALKKSERSPRQDSLLGDVCVALADVSFVQNTAKGLRYAEEAAALLPGGCSIRGGELLVLENNDAFFLPDNAPGRLAEMVDYHYELARRTDSILGGSGLGFEHLFAAEAAFFTGDFSTAAQSAQKAIAKAAPAAQHDIVCNALGLQMRIALFAGDAVAAQAKMDEISAHIDGNLLAGLYPLRDCMHGWLHLRLGRVSQVVGWLSGQGQTPSSMPLALGRDKVILACCHMACGNHAAAYDALLDLEEVFTERGLWVVRLYSHLARAECLLMLRRPQKAVEEFLAACNMSWQNGIFVPFAEFGEATLRLLDEAESGAAVDFSAEWAAQLRRETLLSTKRGAGMRKAFSAGRAAARGGVSLTGREGDILRYLAGGLSRDEIAALMGITVHGVKKHITSIYTKLGAVNRAEAVHIAMSGGLLQEDVP